MKKSRRIDKLRIKGHPAPIVTPTSPLLDTFARVNKPNENGLLALRNAYDFVLHPASKHTIELPPPPGTPQVKGRVDFLNRVQQANFGISTMDSPYITSEGTILTEKPRFVLCGKSASGYSPLSFNKYLSEQRVGNYKASAQEIYRARHNVRSIATANSEPCNGLDNDSLLVGGEGCSKDDYFKDDKSTVSYITAPNSDSVSLPTMKSGSHQALSAYEPKRKRELNNSPASRMTIRSQDSGSAPRPKTYHVSTSNVVVKKHPLTRASSELTPRDKVTYQTPSMAIMNDGSKSAKYAKSFMKRGIRNFNNPYRLLKNRERQIVVRTQNLNMKSVEKITKMNGKHENGEVMIKLPRNSADHLLMDMILDLNSPKGHSTSSKYSDVALHRDLDECMTVRSPSSRIRSPTKSVKSRAAKSNIDDLEEESLWAGNDVDEELNAIVGK